MRKEVTLEQKVPYRSQQPHSSSPAVSVGGSTRDRKASRIRQMSSFYDGKDLEEELSRVSCPDDDLSFEYLFEYEPPCSDFPGGDQGLSVAARHLSLPPPLRVWVVG